MLAWFNTVFIISSPVASAFFPFENLLFHVCKQESLLPPLLSLFPSFPGPVPEFISGAVAQTEKSVIVVDSSLPFSSFQFKIAFYYVFLHWILILSVHPVLMGPT